MSLRPAQICISFILAAAIVLIATSQGQAQRVARATAGPFAGMNGPWRGSGTVTLKGGTRERIRCRARYNVNSGSDNLRQVLRCASDSYKFVLRSNVFYRNGAISGRWSESSRNLAGTVVGTARGRRISARIISDIFTAFVAVATFGSRQRVTINSPGSKLENVSISLRRSR